MGEGGNLDKFLLFATRVAERVVPDTCTKGILGTVTSRFPWKRSLSFLLLNLHFWESDYIVIFSGCFSTKNVAILMRCAFPKHKFVQPVFEATAPGHSRMQSRLDWDHTVIALLLSFVHLFSASDVGYFAPNLKFHRSFLWLPNFNWQLPVTVLWCAI